MYLVLKLTCNRKLLKWKGLQRVESLKNFSKCDVKRILNVTEIMSRFNLQWIIFTTLYFIVWNVLWKDLHRQCKFIAYVLYSKNRYYIFRRLAFKKCKISWLTTPSRIEDDTRKLQILAHTKVSCHFTFY